MARALWEVQGGGGIISDECTAQESDVLKGKTAIVKDGDEPVEGTLEVQSIVNFKVAVYGNLSLVGTWRNPGKGPYSGVMMRYKAGSYPASVSDGSQAYEGSGNSFTAGGLSAGVTYYFRAWSYITTNHGRIYANGYQEATGTPQIVKGNATYTSSGKWMVPANVRSVDVFLVGGGGNGGDGGDKQRGGGGGGGGYTRTYKNMSVTPGQVITVSIGGSGGASYFGSYSALAGNNGFTSGGGSGGSDGGGGASTFGNGGSGGSNGGNGAAGSIATGGGGQGTTTRAFGESSGTLYAGGGGGGGYTTSGGAAGAGGGGSGGGGSYTGGSNGGSNTGGGGGGGHWNGMRGDGGTGIILIRWGY